ncbi:MAG: UV DNA damage repair endonuclease UvsE [Clostridia bacterium]|nr:UV DNA damage repair endonuclease UvsE [Clostridia bacterium]
MRFRLGYVAMTLNLEDCSPSGAVTYTTLSKIPDEKARLYKLRQVTKKNLENTLRILKYNKAMDIRVYRLTSKLVPLATHPSLQDWDYTADFQEEFKEIGRFILENRFRVSAHPDHFTLINATDPKILQDSIRDLDYHVRLFEAMGLEDYSYKLVLHVGGLYKDKEASIERFKENFMKLPDRIRLRIILENDDKSFSAQDVYGICTELGIPMVLDVHHHKCVNHGEALEEVIPLAFETWDKQKLLPKVHFSSPKSPKDFRSHADDIDYEEFSLFLRATRKANRDFDVMLEAKNKDTALLKLSDVLAQSDELKRINRGEFEMV